MGVAVTDMKPMDSHVRWFRREVGRLLLRRLAVETVAVVGIVVAGVAASGGSTQSVILATSATALLYPAARWAVGCLTNATSSSYLNNWPRPSGELVSVPQTNIGLPVDIALTAAGLRFYDAYSEWGGATTSVYGSHDPLLVTTSADDDIAVITGLTDGRLCISTTQLIPPNERLIVNHEPASDVTSLLASHGTLVETLTTQGAEVADADINFVVDFLLLEWESWQQVGPFIAPFVDMDHRLHPSVLTVRVSTGELLQTGLSQTPFIRPVQSFPSVTVSQPNSPTAPSPTTPHDTHTGSFADAGSFAALAAFDGLAALRDQADLAAEQTDRALAGPTTAADLARDGG